MTIGGGICWGGEEKKKNYFQLGLVSIGCVILSKKNKQKIEWNPVAALFSFWEREGQRFDESHNLYISYL